jgi:antitoxin ParD1/3/4
MQSLMIILPDSLKTFVEEQAAKEGFPSVSEYLEALVREVQKRKARKELEDQLLEGLHSGGEDLTVDDQFWEELHNQLDEDPLKVDNP